MKELVCIVCPNGCRLSVNVEGDKVKVDGAKCKKGIVFAEEEIISPKRTVCTTVRTAFSEMPVIPVRTKSDIPKALISDMMELVSKITLDKKLRRGESIIENILNTGVDIIVTSDMTKY